MAFIVAVAAWLVLACWQPRAAATVVVVGAVVWLLASCLNASASRRDPAGLRR